MKLDRMIAIACAATLPLFGAARAAPAPADCSKAAIPATAANGKLGGADFAPSDIHFQAVQQVGINGVTYDANTLYLNGTDASGGQMSLSVSTISPQGKPIDGRTFRTVPGDIGVQPEAGPGAPETQGWSLEYEAKNIDANSIDDKKASLRLEFGKRKGAMLPGKITFCASGGNWLAGTFAVDMSE